ncbi:hypothetical protein OK074_2782 [Actinobacteria bacterium OK074]|nr:hypothetical protein OK074_2782 [Actinobacteria bacterium OK074]
MARHEHDHDGHHDHDGQHAQHGHGGQHGHHHGYTDLDWGALADHLEGQAEVFAPLYRQIAGWLAARGAEPGLIVDAGSGPGVISGLFAETFPGARVVAADGSEPLLARARERADRLGIADRFSTLTGELPDVLGDLDYPADLLWASRSLHHVGDQQAALTAFADRLAPGGMLALLEGGLPVRCLPRDIGIGRPGLESRIDAVETVAFAEMRAALPGAESVTEDWPGLLASAGLVDRVTRSFLFDLPAPLDDAARAYVVDEFRRRADALSPYLDADDRATQDRLLDPDDKASLYHRTDLFLLTAVTVYTGRAAA